MFLSYWTNPIKLNAEPHEATILVLVFEDYDKCSHWENYVIGAVRKKVKRTCRVVFFALQRDTLVIFVKPLTEWDADRGKLRGTGGWAFQNISFGIEPGFSLIFAPNFRFANWTFIQTIFITSSKKLDWIGKFINALSLKAGRIN
eukprot:6271335-Amphidinium_carterae.1